MLFLHFVEMENQMKISLEIVKKHLEKCFKIGDCRICNEDLHLEKALFYSGDDNPEYATLYICGDGRLPDKLSEKKQFRVRSVTGRTGFCWMTLPIFTAYGISSLNYLTDSINGNGKCLC